MPLWNDGLAGVHLEIASDQGTVLHVLAGPGTGKTFAMIRRVARLLSLGVAPDSILAVSFTRTAALDLREQLLSLVAPGASDVRASTLHSLCFGILSSQQAFSHTNRVPRPLLSYEIDCLEEDMKSAFGGKKAVRKLLKAYEAAWARLQQDTPGYAPSPTDQAFEASLVSWLRFHEAMLIGELVPLTLTYARANPGLSVLPSLRHVLVDEYQDLNRADQALVRMLAANGSLLVIGDDNQSIYSFRHANPDGVRTFPTDVPGTVPYAIAECRRCPPNIVAMSNALISHDSTTSRPSPLVPDTAKAPATVNIVQFDTLAAEVTTVAEYIDSWLADHPDTPPGRVLVLAPRRFVGNAIKDALIARGRNALSYYFEDELEVDNAARGFCLLSLMVNPLDRAAIRAWLGFGGSELLRRPYARLRTHCETHGLSLSEVLESLTTGAIAIPRTAPLVSRWQALQIQLAILTPLAGTALVDALWPSSNADTAAIRVLAGAIALKGVSNEELLGELREAITQPNLPDSGGDVIQVMSLHKSKGLTRDLVVMAGCMAGTLPHLDDDDPAEIQQAQLDEQRRLFYVGITRATKELLVSAAASLPVALAMRGNAKFSRRFSRDGEAYAATAFSQFISELGASAPPPVAGGQFRLAVGLGSP